MISNKLKLISAIVVGVTTSQFANAALTVISSNVGGAASFASRVNFDDITDQVAGLPFQSTVNTAVSGPSGSLTLAFTAGGGGFGAGAVRGSTGNYAAPVLSGSNGVGFGSPDQPIGDDTTTYLTTGRGNGSVTMTFAGAGKQRYFGLLWGSVDSYNKLSFYDGATWVGDVIPGTTAGMPTKNGNQQAIGTVYANIFSSIPFDKVIATSIGPTEPFAFEFDNVSFSPVPEPSTYVAGLLLALPVVVQGVRRLKNRQ